MYTAAGTVDVEQRINDYAPLVRRMAHHLAAKLPSSVQIDDIIQAGLIGLMDAANRFEAAQGNQFETYAVQRIRGFWLFFGEWNGTHVHCCWTSGVKSPPLFEKIVAYCSMRPSPM